MGRWFESYLPFPSTELHLVFPTGVVAPSPPCNRALQIVTSLLEEDGHEIISMSVHSCHRRLPTALSRFFTVTLPAH